MFIPMYAQFHCYSLIFTILLVVSVKGRMEMPENEAALEFAKKWLANPKMYIGVIVPNKSPFRTCDIVRLTKKVLRNHKNTYLMIDSNVTKYNTLQHTQNELIWYPFNIEHYRLDCLFLDSNQYDRLYKKHFLFFKRKNKNVNFSFESCKVRLDSHLVIYHTKQKNETIVQFDEVYKISEKDDVLVKITLGEMIHGRKELRLSGLNLSLWNRRKSLNGEVLNAVVKKDADEIAVIKSKERFVIKHPTYLSDVMDYLTQRLNFSLNLTASESSFNDISMDVGSGRYDIGYNGFSQSLLRKDYVDFSLALWDPTYGLYYVIENQKLSMGTYLHPFTSHAWIFLTIYVAVLVSGFIFIKIVVVNEASILTLQKISEAIQRGCDIVLRSLIVKRQRCEPLICSSKITFLVLIFTGFVIFNMYRAVLVAFLAIEEDNPPISDLKDFANSDYSLGVRNGTAMDAIFSNSKLGSDEYMLNISGKIARYSESSALRVVDLMVRNDPKASQTILFDFDTDVPNSQHYPCKISRIRSAAWKANQFGMLFKKRWPLTELFNYHLLVMKESGLMERMYQRHLKKSSNSCPDDYPVKKTVKYPRPVGINKTFSLYIALAIGFATSFLFLLVEELSARQHNLNFSMFGN